MKYDYDVVVLGGGAAGLVAATGASGLGLKTALIEKNKLGGDCTWYGCVPSKALLKSAQVFSLLKRFGEFGISNSCPCAYDPSGIMSHVREIAGKIGSHHPAELFEKRGIKVLFGDARFRNRFSIELDGKIISSKRFIICTGSHPMVPPIEGLGDLDYLTNENVFDLESLPKSIAVLGGGPIGMEMSQAFLRLGVEVSIIEMLDRLLFREDGEVARVLTDALEKEGARIYAGRKAVKFSKQGDSVSITLLDKANKKYFVNAEKVLVAVGRSPNVQGLGLEKAGVKYSNKGIAVDATLRTSAGNIYACGDVVGPYQFSHMAEYQAIIVVGNLFFPFKRRVDYSAVPWCTFTDPELAHLGLTEEEARARYKRIKVYRSEYRGNDRAVIDIKEKGMVKVICDRKGKIFGAHIVGENAGELIHEYVLAKSANLNIGNVSSCIHVYPTLSQVSKRAADNYYMDMLSSPLFKKISRFFISLMK